MIRHKVVYIIFTVLSSICFSCNTYTKFYSVTYTSVSDHKIADIYRLDLSNQNLDSLPIAVSKLTTLKMLNLSNNPNLNLDLAFKKLNQCKDIEVLILDSLNIDKIPASIIQFTSLKQLSLANNPKLNLEYTFDIASVLPIEYLNLRGNTIEKLPENSIKLKSVKDLNLSFNRLKGNRNYELIAKLPKLYSLWIDHNELEVLPSSIGAINKVRFLYFDHNKLEKLPEEMSAMRTWVIHAGYNNFKVLPKVFTKMRSLFMVHINNNSITVIPESYTTEKYPLAGLILDNNPISENEKRKAAQLFKGFFLLSFEQK